MAMLCTVFRLGRARSLTQGFEVGSVFEDEFTTYME